MEQFRKQLGKALKDQRLRRGLTQIDCAKLLGISQGNLSKIEAGILEPKASVYIRMKKRLKIKEC